MRAPPINFVETNKVDSVMRRVLRKLESFVNGDNHASGAEYDAVFANVQIGKTPRQRTMLPTDTGAFLRYMVFGSNAGVAWGYVATNFRCSIRTLDQAACKIAQIIALESGQMMYAERALELFRTECDAQ